MSEIQKKRVEKIAKIFGEVEEDISEALQELRILRVSASKHAVSDAFFMQKISEIIEILER